MSNQYEHIDHTEGRMAVQPRSIRSMIEKVKHHQLTKHQKKIITEFV